MKCQSVIKARKEEYNVICTYKTGTCPDPGVQGRCIGLNQGRVQKILLAKGTTYKGSEANQKFPGDCSVESTRQRVV